MKKLYWLLLLLVICNLGCNEVSPVITLEAQSFPFIVHAEVQPPNASDNVTIGTAVWDNGTPVSFSPITDATCSCVRTPTFSVPDANTHSVALTWTNSWGMSQPTILSFQVKVPTKPAGTIKGGS